MDWETPKTVRTCSFNFEGSPMELTRKQIQTELEVLKLKEQVQKLGNKVEKRKSVNGDYEDKNIYIRELESKCEELGARLNRSEADYDDLRAGLKASETERLRETSELEERINDLTRRLQDEKHEKAKIKSVYDKSQRTLNGLRGYLEQLPSKEEFNELKASLTVKESLCSDLANQLEMKKLHNDQKEKSLRDLNIKVLNLVTKNEETQLKLDTAEEKIRNHEKRLESSLRMNPNDTEQILAQNDILTLESTKLKKYIKVLKIRHKKELDSDETALSETKTRSNTLESELCAVNEQSVKHRETIELQRKTLREIEEKWGSATKRIQILEVELRDARQAADRDRETDDIVENLIQELGLCLREIGSLSSISKQIVSGEDPNVSLLFGIERLSECFNVSSENTISLRIDVLRNQLIEIKRIKKEIKEMRMILVDKYAENLGNNMTSCITQ